MALQRQADYTLMWKADHAKTQARFSVVILQGTAGVSVRRHFVLPEHPNACDMAYLS